MNKMNENPSNNKRAFEPYILKGADWWLNAAKRNGEELTLSEENLIRREIATYICGRLEKYDVPVFSNYDFEDNIKIEGHEMIKFPENTSMKIKKDCISVSEMFGDYEQIWPKNKNG